MQSTQKNIQRIIFVQDAIDPDNLSSAVAISRRAKTLASQGYEVHLDVIVSTACRDLSRPRFSPAPPKFGGHQEALAGAPAPDGKKLLSLSSGNLSDNLAMQAYDASLLASVIIPELTDTSVQLRMIPDDITKSGLWEPLMPMTQLIRQIHQECRSQADPFSMVASYKKYIQELDAKSADAYRPTDQGGTVYKPELDSNKEARAAKYRQMMEGFFCFLTDRQTALNSIVAGAAEGQELTMILCAPVGFVASLLKLLLHNDLTSSIKQVWGEMLTLNPKDNLVGCQWNEYLDLEAATFVLSFLQEHRIPTFLLPTQIFKATETMTSVAEEIYQLAIKTPPAEMSTALSHQLVWNVLKANPPLKPGKAQPIFDPLVIYWLENPDKIKSKKIHLKFDGKRYTIHDDDSGCITIPNLGNYSTMGEYLDDRPATPFVDPKGVLAFYLSCYDNTTEEICHCCQTETTEESYIVNLFNNIKRRVQHPLVLVSIAFALGNIVSASYP